MNSWNSYWYGFVAAVRPLLLVKGFLLLLWLDAWTLMIPPAALYGAGGFNVAHFRWLDAIHPLPTPAVYMAVVVLVGWLALHNVLAGLNRLTIGAMFVLYTYGWSMSLLDRYQHHYFISWVLLCLAFFPQPLMVQCHFDNRGERDRSGGLICAWGYVLLSVTVAIVYAYSAFAKLEDLWLSGLTLNRIAEDRFIFPSFVAWCQRLGIHERTVWATLAAGVVWLEFCLAAAYLVVPKLVAIERRGTYSPWSLLALVSALALHITNECLALNIGLFSYYMMLLACAYFLPVSWLAAVGRIFSWPRGFYPQGSSRAAAFLAAAAVMIAVLTALAGYNLDLPGAGVSGGMVALSLLGVTYKSLMQRKPGTALRQIAAIGIGAVLLWLAVTVSETRFRFYTLSGHSVPGHPQSQHRLSLYEKALHYARNDTEASEAHNNLGRAWQEKGGGAEAIEHYRHAARLAPQVAAVHANLAVMLRATEQFEEAVEQLKLAVAIDADDVETRLELADLLVGVGKLDEAVSQYEQAIRTSPDLSAAHFNLGLALKMSGRLKEAVHHFQDAVRLDRNWPAALNALAWLHATSNEDGIWLPQEAVRLAQRAADLTKHEDPAILDTWSVAEAAAGQFDRARLIGQRALAQAEAAGASELVSEIKYHLEHFERSEPYFAP